MERILDILDNDNYCGLTDAISLILQNHISPDEAVPVIVRTSFKSFCLIQGSQSESPGDGKPLLGSTLSSQV